MFCPSLAFFPSIRLVSLVSARLLAVVVLSHNVWPFRYRPPGIGRTKKFEIKK
jgi:hypothetical protein